MALRTRYTIDPHDIVAIDYECRQCHCRYSVSTEQITKPQIKCPQCGAEWISVESLESDPIVKFVRCLRSLQDIALEVHIRLEITNPQGAVKDR